MRILLAFAFAFGVSFINAIPVVFPDVDNTGYFAVEQVILNPDSLAVADLIAQASETDESVSDSEPAPKHDDLSILAPIAFILKPTTEKSKPVEPVEPVKKSSSSEESSEELNESNESSTEPSSQSSSTEASLASTSALVVTSSSAKPSTKAPCKAKEGESKDEPCKEVHRPVITEDEEEDLKEKAAEVEADPVILTPSVKK